MYNILRKDKILPAVQSLEFRYAALTFLVIVVTALATAGLTISLVETKDNLDLIEGLQASIDALGSESDYAWFAGQVSMFGGEILPSGWLECDGSLVLRTDYPDLYAAIGDTWSNNVTVANSTHFVLPDFRARSPVGEGSGIVYDVDLLYPIGFTLRGGPKELGEMDGATYPSGIPTNTEVAITNEGAQNFFGSGSNIFNAEIAEVGEEMANNQEGGNYHPYSVVKFMIKT